MDSSNERRPLSPKSSSPNSVPIRVTKSTARLLRSLLSKCNKKSHGRRVKADDIIKRSLELLNDSHLEEIKESTFSSQDKLEIEFKKYCQLHGPTSKEKFLSLLLQNGLPQITEPQKDEHNQEQL